MKHVITIHEDGQIEVKKVSAADEIGSLQNLAIKFLTNEAKGTHSAHPWPVPANGAPGEWQEVKRPYDRIVPCKNAIHAAAATDQSLQLWSSNAARVFLIELDGDLGWNSNKFVARRGRLIRELDYPTTVSLKRDTILNQLTIPERVALLDHHAVPVVKQ